MAALPGSQLRPGNSLDKSVRSANCTRADKVVAEEEIAAGVLNNGVHLSIGKRTDANKAGAFRNRRRHPVAGAQIRPRLS